MQGYCFIFSNTASGGIHGKCKTALYAVFCILVEIKTEGQHHIYQWLFDASVNANKTEP